MRNMCQYALDNDLEAASNLNEKLMPLHQNLFLESNPIPVKWVLSQMGLIQNTLRLPLTPLSEKHHAVLSEVMHKLTGN